MNFAPKLTTFEPFIDRLPEKTKIIKMNMNFKILLRLDN
jgi:hypothetical protein